MNSLTKTFTYGSSVIRTGGTLENPLFCVHDICKVLGIKNPSDKFSGLDDDEKDRIETLDSIGRRRKKPACSESGLYNIIFSVQDNPHTKKFKRWVFHEVLPAIRKTGKYENSELVKQNAILKDTTKTQHNLIQAMAKENRQFNITEVLETDRACRNAMSPALANNLAKRHARAHGWKTKDIYTNTERLELISAFRKRLVYDCQSRRVVFAK